MVPAIALAPDTRLEIFILDGQLDVIKAKKPEKVSQILTSEQYQLKLAKVLARYIRTAHLGRTVLFYNSEVSFSVCDYLYSLPDTRSSAHKSRCLVVGILDAPLLHSV